MPWTHPGKKLKDLLREASDKLLKLFAKRQVLVLTNFSILCKRTRRPTVEAQQCSETLAKTMSPVSVQCSCFHTCFSACVYTGLSAALMVCPNSWPFTSHSVLNLLQTTDSFWAPFYKTWHYFIIWLCQTWFCLKSELICFQEFHLPRFIGRWLHTSGRWSVVLKSRIWNHQGGDKYSFVDDVCPQYLHCTDGDQQSETARLSTVGFQDYAYCHTKDGFQAVKHFVTSRDFLFIQMLEVKVSINIFLIPQGLLRIYKLLKDWRGSRHKVFSDTKWGRGQSEKIFSTVNDIFISSLDVSKIKANPSALSLSNGGRSSLISKHDLNLSTRQTAKEHYR